MTNVNKTGELAYRLWGRGAGDGVKTVVIDAAIGTCGAEWWHIAEILGERFRVVTYDRLGYGKSGAPTGERTPQNIAAELDELLTALNVNDNIILLGHSQGGFYAAQYALTYPSKVAGMVLLDPATPFDNEFLKRLTKEQYKKSGVDKTFGLKLGLWASTLRLGFAVKLMLKKMPPFYYHKFSEEAEKYLLDSLCRKTSYAAALEEYKFTHDENAARDVKDAVSTRALGSVPLRLITHSSEVYHKELQEFGNMDLRTAVLIEGIWQEIMKKMLGLSHDARHITAENSGHYIHLTDFNTVYKTLKTL